MEIQIAEQIDMLTTQGIHAEVISDNCRGPNKNQYVMMWAHEHSRPCERMLNRLRNVRAPRRTNFVRSSMPHSGQPAPRC